MIKINMEMPENCEKCRMVDEEFAYCHAKGNQNSWECWDELDNGKNKRPSWCPLIEVQENENKGNN